MVQYHVGAIVRQHDILVNVLGKLVELEDFKVRALQRIQELEANNIEPLPGEGD